MPTTQSHPNQRKDNPAKPIVAGDRSGQAKNANPSTPRPAENTKNAPPKRNA